MVHQRIVAADAAAMARLAAEWLAGETRLCTVLRGACSLCLAGGTTPRSAYEVLSGPALAATIPWDRIHVFFGDERGVPRDHPDSNYHMAADALLSRVPIPSAQVHRMEAEAADPEAAAARYAALLPEVLDILVLGIGADGHTASLFPGSPALREGARRVVTARAPEPPRLRLTITPPVIAAARRILVLAAGPDKAEAVARALKGGGTPDRTPARLARDGVWFLDRAAASLLAD